MKNVFIKKEIEKMSLNPIFKTDNGYFVIFNYNPLNQIRLALWTPMMMN